MRAALVTGASRGIGRACALELARRGCRVGVNYKDDAEGADSAVQEIRRAGGDALAFRADVTKSEEVREMIGQLNRQFARLDVLVNNVGASSMALFPMLSEEALAESIRLNLYSAFIVSSSCYRTIRRSDSGRIVFVSSAAATLGGVGQAHYAASKSALLGLMRSLARELAPHAVTVNAVTPGFIESGSSNALPGALRKSALRRVALSRMGRPEEVAAAIGFLTSIEAGYVTGQILGVDGGLSIG